MEEVEEEYRKQVKQDLDELSDEEWEKYRTKFAEDEKLELETVTKELLASKLTIKEPFIIYSGDHEISLRLTRIADIIKAQKFTDKEYGAVLKKIQNRTEHGIPGEELQAKKKAEVEEIQKQKAKKLISYIKAFSIISIDGETLSDTKKIEVIKDRDLFPRHVTQDLDSFLDQLKHGIFHEEEFTCPVCGKLNKESLQYSISASELLPINPKSERDSRQHTRLNIRFGA
jgi:hypothetical protein